MKNSKGFLLMAPGNGSDALSGSISGLEATMGPAPLLLLPCAGAFSVSTLADLPRGDFRPVGLMAALWPLQLAALLWGVTRRLCKPYLESLPEILVS
jgi:hypothetical protein